MCIIRWVNLGKLFIQIHFKMEYINLVNWDVEIKVLFSIFVM